MISTIEYVCNNFGHNVIINGKWTISNKSYESPTENYGGRKNLHLWTFKTPIF